MIAVIDVCGSNLASVRFAFERLGCDMIMTHDPEQIQTASHVILPGVGPANLAIDALKTHGLDRLLPSLSQPVLGICLGMQILYEHSEEGDTECLGIFPGCVKRFKHSKGLTVPHMGWNTLSFDKDSSLQTEFESKDRVYYVHSYCAEVNDVTLATTDYGQCFAGIAQKGNFYGMQFHPEKSGKVGEQLLRNFLDQ